MYHLIFFLFICLNHIPTLISQPFAYVTNGIDATVQQIDTATNTPGVVISVPGSPSFIAITPDNKRAYVSLPGNGQVIAINLTTNIVESIITVGSFPSGIAITPDRKTAYVANNGDDTVTPIAIATNIPGTPINLAPGSAPFDIAITPNGATLYVVDSGASSVTPIDIATNTAKAPITGVPGGQYIAITPDGTKMYVTNNNGEVFPILIPSGTVGTPISIAPGNGLGSVVIAPNGKSAYVAVSNFNYLQVIDVATDTAGAIIIAGSNPLGTAITPNGSTIYVTNISSASVTPIDVATNSAETSIPVGNLPTAIAIMSAPTVSNFVGCVKRNTFLNKQECILCTTWTPASFGNVLEYRIYQEDAVIGTVLGSYPARFATCITNMSDLANFSLTAVGFDGIESAHIPLQIVSCNKI